MARRRNVASWLTPCCAMWSGKSFSRIRHDYDCDDWFARVRGMEHEPARGVRCKMCFDMRFERTARYPGLISREYSGRQGGGSARMIEIRKSETFYQQEYCVYAYSLRDTNLQREANGCEPIGGGAMYYTKDAPEVGNPER
ncbi:epoxyqueuosine reductase QueH [Burkholderia aenigmatica]|uniref:epoxyqueuosine reductase QueH n=1 Tax=Burkholderia aenigmatica TaxID=2015348 RepID=UPI003B430660